MINFESVQIIKDNNEPKFAVLDYKLYQELREIVEDFLDHQHAESVLKEIGSGDWVDFSDVKKELDIE